VRTLADLARTVKSANAGATWLTLDVVFDDAAVYRQVTEQSVLSPAVIAGLYKFEETAIAVYHCDQIRTIKVTIPRGSARGGPAETDFDGTQQFVPLLGLPVEL
jgi:hypothetical protein